jgi:hypothetical protein
MRLFFSKENHGELKPGTTKRWINETPNIKSLPEHKKTTKKHEKKASQETKVAELSKETKRKLELVGAGAGLAGLGIGGGYLLGGRKLKGATRELENLKWKHSQALSALEAEAKKNRPNPIKDAITKKENWGSRTGKYTEASDLTRLEKLLLLKLSENDI